MPETLWIAAGFLLLLPAEMKPVAATTERVANLNLQPPVLGHTDQLFCSWSDERGASIVLHWWNAPTPPRDLGPLSLAEKWEVSMGGRHVSAARTNHFMGRKDEVLVAWPPVTDHNASALLHARGLSKESFDRILSQSNVIDAGQPWSMTCKSAPQNPQ
ncbi:hypothetical protein [Microvirga mediterraneensis]|uniref:Uncharacterized protein n=1 Tax=Microvirga mediterraneensis TaxID=2754695 RepID=A0A838BKX7_9HYPH|nr:hypothetical protein [Microvirga mediterraneensis]MBA1155749.1 hypothetical protein [Microvirga mediterraneensis]